jgi:hypothetical protein
MANIDVETVLDIKPRGEPTFRAVASMSDEEKLKAIEENTIGFQED